MTLEVVSNPPDAVMSWLMVTLVLASPSKPTAVTLALVPRALRSALRTEDCDELTLARYEPIEKPDSGVTAATEVRVTVAFPPPKIWGTFWVAVTLTALHDGSGGKPVSHAVSERPRAVPLARHHGECRVGRVVGVDVGELVGRQPTGGARVSVSQSASAMLM